MERNWKLDLRRKDEMRWKGKLLELKGLNNFFLLMTWYQFLMWYWWGTLIWVRWNTGSCLKAPKTKVVTHISSWDFQLLPSVSLLFRVTFPLLIFHSWRHIRLWSVSLYGLSYPQAVLVVIVTINMYVGKPRADYIMLKRWGTSDLKKM